MNAKIYFAMLLILGLAVPKIYCAEQPQVNSGEQLYDSVRHHDYEHAKELIRTGANVNYSEERGITPLMIAVLDAGDIELIKMLVQHGANVNAKNLTGMSVFHYLVHGITPTAEANFSAIATILLDAGANINAKTNNGRTPLHYAVSEGLNNKVRYLLDHGANPKIKDKEGKAPINYVPQHNWQLPQMLLLTPHRSHYKK